MSSSLRSCSASSVTLLCVLAASSAGAGDFVSIVGEIRAGSSGSVTDFPARWGRAGAKVLLAADDGVNGVEPWLIEPGAPAVSLIENIRGSGSGLDVDIVTFWNLYDKTLFVANDGFLGNELWISDGTPGGTQMVEDLTPGPGGTTIAVVGIDRNRIYWNNSGDLWVSDGTEPGTQLVADISLAIGGIVPYGGLLMLDPGNKLWKSDGTGPGTTLVTAAVFPRFSDAKPVNFRGKLYFVGSDANGIELWRTDATSPGTERVVDIVNGAGSSNPRNLVVVDNLLFFTASEPTNGQELWVYDGITVPTGPVLDILPGNNGSQPKNLFALGGKLYFDATDGTHGHELWVSDGTSLGTHMVVDTVAGTGSSNPSSLRRLGDRLLFLAQAPAQNLAWVSNGTPEGTLSLDVNANLAELAPIASDRFAYAMGGPNTLSFEPWAVDLARLSASKFCSTPHLAIGDLDVARPTIDRIYLDSSELLLDLDVEVEIGHEYPGDLTVSLTHAETATTVNLLQRPGSTNCSGSDVAIVFDEEAATLADIGCVNTDPAFPRRSHWRPTQSLSSFVGDELGGTWVITVVDGAAQDRGVLRSWCLAARTSTIARDGFESGGFGGWWTVAR